jgi:hypothetical protein
MHDAHELLHPVGGQDGDDPEGLDGKDRTFE